MRRGVPILLLLALAAPAALAAHSEGSGPRALGGRTVPVPETMVTIEAEDFADKQVGSLVQDAAATGGQAWRMPTYGVIETTVNIPESGVLWIEIRAKGSHPPGLLNPHMHPLVNGEQRGEWDVFGDWLVYRQALPVLAGTHRIGVDNFNNYHAPADDRTLVVDWVRLTLPTLEGTPHVGASGVLVVDAADIHNSVTGTIRQSDDARNGTEWLAWGIGCYAQAVVFEQGGEHALVPRLRGNVHDGEGTHVIVRVDVQEVDEYHVGEDWEEHETRFTVEPGVHVLDVCYDNDHAGEKRNLWLDEMTVTRLGAWNGGEWGGGSGGSGGVVLPAAPDWPLPHADLANTRHVPSQVDASNVGQAREAWRYDAAGPVTGTPAYSNGVLFFGDHGGKVHAVRASDGAAVWSVDHGAGVDSSVALDEDHVYVGDMKGWLSARDRETGDLVWRVRADPVEGTHLYGSPVAHGGRVYTGVASEQTLLEYEGPQNFRGSVAAFDAATGDLVWRTHTQSPDGTGVSVWSTPAVDPDLGLLFVGTGNAYGEPAGDLSDAMLALRLDDGGIAWSFQATPNDAFNARGSPGPDRDFGSSPVLFEIDGRKVVGEGDKGGRFYVLDRQTGELVWETMADFKAEGVPSSQVEGFLGAVAYADGVLHAPTTARSMVHAFDATSGRLLWATELNPLPQRYGDRMFGASTVTNAVVLQGNAFGRVFALDAATGDVLANLSMPGGVQGGIVVAGDRFVAPHVGEHLWSGQGGLVAFTVPVQGGGGGGGGGGGSFNPPSLGGNDGTPPTESSGPSGREGRIPFAGAWLTAASAAAAAWSTRAWRRGR